MSTFLMLGKYSAEAIKAASAERTAKVYELVKGLGGEVVSIHALLGAYDLAILVKLPGMAEAVKASVALARATGIGFSTFPAMEVEEFDKVVGSV